MALSVANATDIANAALKFYVRGKAFAQTIQEKPLARILRSKTKTFGGGNNTISIPVQGAFMSDTNAGDLNNGAAAVNFLKGYSGSDQLSFTTGNNLLRAEFNWYEVHSGFTINWTDLKRDGITIVDSQKVRTHSDAELTRLTGLLENKLEDYTESYARAFNTMVWGDGTQDALAIPGLRALLTETPNASVVGGLSSATYSWWRPRSRTTASGGAIAASPQNQTLTRTLRSEVRQLRRYGGKPTVLLAGSAFIDALELEVQEKGIYTQEGFRNEGKTDIGMADISMRGVGSFEYDPTLDDLGLAKRCYIIDPTKLTLRPMEGEDDKILSPERPYDKLVFLRSMTYTGALTVHQLNCHGIYEVA